MSSDSNDPNSDVATGRRRTWKKWLVFAVLAAAFASGLVMFRDQLTLRSLARQEASLREFQTEHPVLVYAVAFLVYVSVTGLMLPGATALTLVYAWYFGFLRGLILVSFASTTGATVAFLLSRYLLREAIQKRFGGQLVTFNRALEQEGAFYLFTLRLIVAVPFFVINVVMGLTPIRVTTYWWVSQLGMLPGTCVYVYAGSTVPDLNTLAERGAGGIFSWQLVIAFALLGAFPLIVKKIWPVR